MSASLSSNTPIIVAGPTGVGKSTFAVELATRFDGEIIGADAFQVYAGMEILTAQPGPDLLRRVPHHLVGFLSPGEPFDAARFAALAREKIAEVSARGHRPVIAGGSGLYLKALTHGLAELPPPDPALRAELAGLSLSDLQNRLDALDPRAPDAIDFQNSRRLLRALEIHAQTGQLPSQRGKEWEGNPKFLFNGILLVRERAEQNARIGENVRAMFERGVVDEVRNLGELGSTASSAIGLREIRALLRGEIREQECVEAIIRATRRYAKRQLTWCRNQFKFRVIDLTGLRHTHEYLSDAVLSGSGLA